MRLIKASDIFEVEVKQTAQILKAERKLEFPFNLNLRTKDEYLNIDEPALFCLAYNKQSIYIGRSGRNVIDRCKKQLLTVTGRGYNIGFTNRNNLENLPDVFRNAFKRENYRLADTGLVTTLNKLRFAADNFDKFQAIESNDILNDFEILYCSANELETPESYVEVANELIAEFTPVCNNNVDLNCKFTISDVKNSLKSYCK